MIGSGLSAMRFFPAKLLSIILALAVSASAQLCLCVDMKPVVARERAAHACCKPEPRKSASTPVKDSCADCNLRNHQVTSAPERSSIDSATDLVTRCLHPQIILAIGTAELQTRLVQTAYCAVEDVPIPPLLSDLHHRHCLLTV